MLPSSTTHNTAPGIIESAIAWVIMSSANVFGNEELVVQEIVQIILKMLKIMIRQFFMCSFFCKSTSFFAYFKIKHYLCRKLLFFFI